MIIATFTWSIFKWLPILPLASVTHSDRAVPPQPDLLAKITHWLNTPTRGRENDSPWGAKAFGGFTAPLTPDQGHFIMGCPAATLLSTGLNDEGEHGELWRHESRLRGLDKDQLLSGEKTAKKRGMWEEKNDDPASCPLSLQSIDK